MIGAARSAAQLRFGPRATSRSPQRLMWEPVLYVGCGVPAGSSGSLGRLPAARELRRGIGECADGSTVTVRRADLFLGARSFRLSDESELLAEFKDYYGPTMNAYEAAATAGRDAELHAELDGLFNEQNASETEGTTSIPATFLRVTVTT
jgi:hypothetical protein